MFVEFSQDIGTWKKGEIHDLPDGVARAFVAGQQARESDAIAHLRASQASEMGRFKAEILDAVKSAVKPAGTTTRTPPSGGGGVNFDAISGGTPASEQDKRRSLTDAMRSVFLVNARGTPPEMAEYGRNRLRLYSDEFTEYHFDPNTGAMEETITRHLADGGLETIKRTGTDSLSGGPTYGFTLKPDYLGTLFKIAREATVFEQGTRKIPVTQGNEAIWPMLDQFKAPTVLNGIPQAAIFAGITLSYLGETTARISSDAATDENRFKVVDLTGMTDFSRDYIVDNYIAMDSEVTRLFGEAIGWIRDWTYIRGDGVAKPQGYFNAKAAITGGPATNKRGTSGHIEFEDIAWMVSHLATMCWQNSRFIANVTTLPDLLAIKNHAGNYVFQPNALVTQAMLASIMGGTKVDEAALTAAPMGTLLGFPVYFSEKVPTLGNTGDLSLVCPYQYGDATRSGVEMGVSDQFYFSTDRIAYRVKMRHYGRSLWRAPYTQADNLTTPASGTQVSPFILLAAF